MIINKTHLGLSFASWVKAVPLYLIFGLEISEFDVNKLDALSCFLQGAYDHDWLFRLISSRFIIPLIVFWLRQPVPDNISNHTIKYCKDQEKKTGTKRHTGTGTFERKANEDQSNGECTNWKHVNTNSMTNLVPPTRTWRRTWTELKLFQVGFTGALHFSL